MDFASSAIFPNIISLTLFNVQDNNEISEWKTYFPNLISLSLWYDYEVNYQTIINIFSKLQNSIKRFTLHCATIIHTSYSTYLRYTPCIHYRTIEYFLLDIDYSNLNLMNNFIEGYDACFLTKTIDFIKCMINIRYIHLMINYYNLEKFLDENEWKNLVNERHQLRKIKLQVIGDTFKNKELTSKMQQIQNDLREIRENIKFQVIYK